MNDELNCVLDQMVMPDHPLVKEAIAAFRRYQEAKANGGGAEDIERYRALAEPLFQFISDYNFGVLGGASRKPH